MMAVIRPGWNAIEAPSSAASDASPRTARYTTVASMTSSGAGAARGIVWLGAEARGTRAAFT
ncbi:MAG: hypothetical protein AAFP86_24185, partial [Planctomycetota bacterium]